VIIAPDSSFQMDFLFLYSIVLKHAFFSKYIYNIYIYIYINEYIYIYIYIYIRLKAQLPYHSYASYASYLAIVRSRLKDEEWNSARLVRIDST